MYHLKISHSGNPFDDSSFSEEASAETFEELVPRARELEQQGVPWMIEDEDGNMKEIGGLE